MTTRERLANRRSSENLSIELCGLRYTITFSRYADGRIAEVFCQNHKTNSGSDVAARDGAIALSFALQHGADFEIVRRALCRDGQGRPSGVLGVALDAIADAARKGGVT